MVPDEQLYISPEEAAKLLGVNKRQIFRMIEKGKIRAKDINASAGDRRIWRVLKEDVITPDTQEE